MNEANGKTLIKKRNKKYHKRRSTKNQIEEEDSLTSRYDSIDISEVSKFTDLPLSSKTLQGLRDSNFTDVTEIQKQAILPALQGRDILGAAKTGSGKTLAFLVPMLEKLFINKWTKNDGLGSLIITPTRELALQIFECLRNVGRYHDFSAGLVIGGKDLKFERSRMSFVNILVATPGRLLQHMDENPLFSCLNLKVLVLDEADRCLDMGFEASMNAIIENLPKERQTLLFSATQTRRVRDLARLSLKDPSYISVHQQDKHQTPDGLAQSCLVCHQHDKVKLLWSFLSSHLNSKILVFLSTCHQVRYFDEVLRQLYIKTPVLALHGKMHQLKRIHVYKQFCKKKHAVLLATDIAARGLDFPAVHWVVQLDCPEDVETYIHRAGRTARYHRGGECLLVLTPSENTMYQRLLDAKLPLQEIKVNPSKMFCPRARLEALLAKKVVFKEMAQRAFVSYVKSVFLMKDKSIFNVDSIDLTQYSRSLGLVICPRVRFLRKHEKMKEMKRKDITTTESDRLQSEESTSEPEEADESQPQPDPSAQQHSPLSLDFGMGEEVEDLLLVKRRDHDLPQEEMDRFKEELDSKKQKKIKPKALAKKIIKKKLVVNSKTVFDEEGEAIADNRREKVSEAGKSYDMNEDGGINIQEARLAMKEEDKKDRVLFREKMKAKKKEMKRKEREERGGATLKQTDQLEESSEGEGSEPDLSWLPDPDKIYGKQQMSGCEDEEEEEEEDALPNKRRRIEESEDDSDQVSLGDEEEFALELLSSKK